MEKKETKDLILEEINKQERNLAWLNRKTKIPYPTLYSIFIQGIINLSDEKLKIINEVLGTNFSL